MNGVAVMVVIGIDGFYTKSRFSRLKNFAFQVEENPYSSMPDYQSIYSILNRLHNENIKVQIADRKSGTIVDAEQFLRVYQ